MANLKSASAEIENAKKVNRSSWEDSTYRQKIESTLAEVVPGLQGEYLTAAAKFFKPEWELRSQKFLKRFMIWSKKAVPEVDLASYAKFGTSQSINLSAMANNLDVGFSAALFQVVNLAAYGLCRRVEPTVNTRGDPVFNVVFLPSGYVRFFLETTGAADDEFTPSDIHELATGVFDFEIKTNQPFAASNFVAAAANAKRQFEEGFDEAAKATEAIKDVCRRLMTAFENEPNMAHSARSVANNMFKGESEQGLVDFCLLVLALHDPNIVRINPSVQKRKGAPDVSVLALSYGPAAAPKVQSGMTNIASLSTPHAKEVLKAAAAQSPTATDPVIPTGNVFRLDAAALGAATTEQLQTTEKSLRERIEQVGSTYSTRIMHLAAAVDKINDEGSAPTINLQAQIDTLRDQVYVLMKLVGGAQPTGNVRVEQMVVQSTPPRAPKSILKPYLKTKARKKASAVPKKKAKKAATKKAAKKTKKRR